MTRRALFAGAILLASCAVLAAPKKPARPGALPRYGMLVFSDLCIHPDSGEFGGQRITLQRFAEVDTVLYEFTAGGLSWPVVASDVTIDPRGQQFYFTVQPPDEDERQVQQEERADRHRPAREVSQHPRAAGHVVQDPRVVLDG